MPFVTFSGTHISLRRGRAALLVVPVLALLWLGVPALAASSPAKPASQRWVNHDTDQWGGWSDPSNAGYATNVKGCDPIDSAQCMLPYPNDWFTRPDPTSATGRRLDLNVLAMPRNIAGKPVDPSAWNDSDGFSAGSEILTVVPGMTENSDLNASRLPTDLKIETNGESNLGVVLLDATTGKVWPTWTEVDQYTSEAGVIPAGSTSPVQQDLIIHPAMNLLDGQRYIVALRHLVTNNGIDAPQSAAFATYVRDYLHHTTGGDPRASHMDRVFADLKEAGWTISTNPKDLFLAWDFTTASTQNVTGRLLAIRDSAFEQLGETKAQIDTGKDVGRAPSLTVSSVTNFTAAQNPNVAREITGTFSVPCYIGPACSPPVKCEQISSVSPFDDCPSPGEFYYTNPTDPDADPSQVPGQTYQAGYICVVGRTGFENQQTLRPVEYGHGLFGSDSEVTASPQEEMANRERTMYCATDWFGFANADVPNAVLALSDLSLFPILIDRTEQGELNFLYLQRLMISPRGFATNAAFQYSDGKSFINLRDGVDYDGNSQGGIYGGTVCAVSIDVRRCALGVPGMDYPILLPRSVDYVANDTVTQVMEEELEQLAAKPSAYDPANAYNDIGYSNLLDLFYPDQGQRQLIIDLLSTLWDRADPDGYAGHMTSTAIGGLLPDCTAEGVVPAAEENSRCPAATPDHHVLMQVAWGDHQVANITAFDEARTIGARALGGPATSSRLGGGEGLLASRLCSDEPGNNPNDPVDGNYCYNPDAPLWDIAPITHYPFNGSAIVIFDSGPDGASPYGTDPPPPSDVPPPDTAKNQDPHEAPRRSCAAQDQKGAFFDLNGLITGVDGYVTDPAQQLRTGGQLAGPPYFAGGWNGTCALP
jgi:hypothetical protein